jgi:hypothetical protein
MDSLPCTCGGDNSRCFKCYGTGLIHAPRQVGGLPNTQLRKLLRKLTSTSPQRQKAASSNTIGQRAAASLTPDGQMSIRSDMIICPACKQEFHFKYFLAHRRQAHPLPKDILEAKKSRNKNTPKLKPSLHSCPKCKQQVRDLAKHLKKQHQAEKSMPSVSKATRTSKKNETQQPHARALSEYRISHPSGKMCGFCRALVPGLLQLKNHFNEAHGFDAASLRSKAAGPSYSKTPGNRPVKNGVANVSRAAGVNTSNPYAQEKRELRMDATYRLGGTARDHGQFGSPVSFDGMGDESSP